MKTCSTCGVEKGLECFNPRYNKCKECRKADSGRVARVRDYTPEQRKAEAARARRWRRANMERFQASNRLRIYGVTSTDWERLMDCNDGLCHACGLPQKSDRNLSLCIDHCHATGRVRGLLCDRCNRALGLLRDDPNVVSKLLHYIQTTGKVVINEPAMSERSEAA